MHLATTRRSEVWKRLRYALVAPLGAFLSLVGAAGGCGIDDPDPVPGFTDAQSAEADARELVRCSGRSDACTAAVSRSCRQFGNLCTDDMERAPNGVYFAKVFARVDAAVDDGDAARCWVDAHKGTMERNATPYTDVTPFFCCAQQHVAAECRGIGTAAFGCGDGGP